jgi:hypothetical protein
MYKADFNEFYPPSSQEGNLPQWFGCQLVCLVLTGYGGDLDAAGLTNPDGAPNSSGTAGFQDDDGKDGYGFRIAPRGRTYGPYNGCEKLPTGMFPTTTNPASEKRPAFKDAFDNPILYYRFGTNAYNDGDNSSEGLSSFNTVYAKKTSGAYLRTDYVLCSQGPNTVWNPPGRGVSDDVTNFFQ